MREPGQPISRVFGLECFVFAGHPLNAFSFLFADGTNKDRQWTVRNVIERLAAIPREKIAIGTVEFEKVTTPEPDHRSLQLVEDVLKCFGGQRRVSSVLPNTSPVKQTDE